MSTNLEDLYDLFPSLTVSKVLMDSAIFLSPSVFFRTVEQRIFGLSNISTVAAWAAVLINDSGIAEERDLVLVGCKKRHFCRLEAHTESYFLLFFEKLC